MNYALWGGYTTPDQYLGYLQRQRTDLAGLNDVLLQRASLYRENASAALSYANALSGTHETSGTLGEHLDLTGISQFQSALAGLPDVVSTRLTVDDADALGKLAQYQVLLRGIPREVSTSEAVTAAIAMGGASLDTKPQVIPVSYGGPYQEQFAAIMAEVAELSRLRADIPVHFELPSAAEVASFVSQIPKVGITEPVHLAPTGGAVGVGPGPPPETAAAWSALSGAEAEADAEAKLAASAESAAGDAAAGAVPKVDDLCAAWETLGAAQKDAAAEGAAAGQAAAAADEAAWQARIASIGAYYDALEKADASAVHTAKDFAPDPAAAQAWEQLALGVDGFAKAVDAAAGAEGWQQLTLDSEYLSKDTAAWSVLTSAEDAATASAARFIASATEIRDLNVSTALVPITAAWEALGGAEKAAAGWNARWTEEELAAAKATGPVGYPPTAAGVGGAGKPPTPPPAAAAGAAEPPDDAAAKWAALTGAEKAAATAADLDAVKFAALQAAMDGNASAASHLAYVYTTLGGDAHGAGNDVKAAGDAAAGAGASFAQGLIVFNGWRTGIAVFAGLAGTVSVIHLVVDAIIELVAITVLAAVGIAAIGAAVGIFIGVANEAQDTLGRISDRLKAVYTAASATGQAIYPLTQNFDALASVIRPEVWELYGDALNLVSGKMGLVGSIAEKTGAYLDQLAAKIIVFINNPGFQKGLSDLIKAGVGVVVQLVQIGKNLGDALVGFAKVMETTHIAEDLLAIINAGAKLLDLITKLPTPILALAVGLHGLYLWGGLLATGLVALLDPLRAAALGIGGVSKAESELAATASDASAWTKLKATIADIGGGFGNLPSQIARTNLSLKDISAMVAGSTVPDLAALKAYSVQTGTAMEDMVPKELAAKVATLGAGMSATGKEALYMAAAAGATGDELDAMAGSEAVATAGTFSLSLAVKGLGASMAGLLANPLTWLVLLAAGVAYATDKIITANDATQQWITSTDQALANSSIYTVIGKNVQDLAAATTQLATAQKTGVGNAGELAAAQQDLTGKLTNELVNTGQVSKAYGIDMPSALNLLQVAQVKTSALMSGPMSAAWQAALVQVRGLVQGYAAMGQGLTQLQGDVSVQLVMNADQLASMAKLNTAWDSWLTLVTGGQTALVGFQQQLATVITNEKAAGAAMDGLNAASLTLTGSWQTLVTNGGTVLDNIRSQSAVLENGAQGTAILNQATKDLAAEMIPLAGNSKEAQAGLLAMVNEANPAITTWQQLTKWVGPLGAAGAAQNLTGIMTKLEVPLSDLQKDAQKLTTSLQADLNPAMASAEFNAEGGQSAFNKFATELTKLGPAAQPTITAGNQVAKILESVDGSAAAAKPQFIAWAESMGLSSVAANKLWTEVSKGVTPSTALAAGLGKASESAKNLGDNSTWAKLKDFFTVTLGVQGNNALKAFDDGVVRLTGHLATVGWGTAYNGFQRDLAGPMTAWFTVSLPHAWDVVTHAVGTGWGTAYNGFQRDFAGPMTAWFTQSLPHAFDVVTQWSGWKTMYDGFMAQLGSPVAGFFKGLPASFSALGSSWLTAVKKMAHDWTTNPVGTIEDTFLHLVPGWFAGVDSGWLGTSKGMGKSFTSNFSDPLGSFFTKTVPGFFASSFSGLWDSTARGMWKDFTDQFGLPSDTFFTKTFPSWLTGPVSQAFSTAWGTAWNGFNRYLISGTDTFLTKTFPGWMSGPVSNAFSTAWGTAWNGFNRYIISGTDTFLTKTLPGWMTGPVSQAFATAWSNAWNGFNRDIISGLATLFTKTLPSWLKDFGTNWYNNVQNMWNWFNGTIIHGFTGFFDTDIPNWLSTFGRKWLSNVQTMWHDFYNNVAAPMGNWFSQSLPNAIKNSFRDSVNWVITNVINRTIDFIDNDILSHLPGSLHVNTIGGVAAGGDIPQHAGGRAIRMPGSGSVPGTGDEDGTHIIAMGGEYMLRKPARMALENKYGHSFLNTLNQADSWLGSGSRGNTASQQPPRHAGGGDVGDGTGQSFPFPAANKYASGAQIVATAEKFEGAPYVYGGTTPAGWDCSGFVDYVLTGLGWSGVPRTSEGQYAWTQHVSEPGPGDLVFAQFPGDNASPGHVGFYIGNGQVLSARDPAEGTGVDSLSSWAGHIVGYGQEPNATGIVGQIVGGIEEAWQGVEGLLNATGDALSGNTAALAGDVSGGAGALLKLAEQGAASVFGAVWDHSVKPITDLVPGDTIPGAIVQGGAADIRQGIVNFMTQQDTNAKASAAAASFGTGVGAVPAQSGSAAAAQAFASAHLAQFGWGQDQMPALIKLWDQESGWNDNAVNPSSGAYGIPQALGKGHPYNLGDYANQVLWGLNYIKQRYGNPALAWAHELANNWYPMGGPVGGVGDSVVGAIEAVTADEDIREAMALGSWLETRWNPEATDGTHYGPFQMALGPGITPASASNPVWSATHMLPAYTRAVNQAGPLWNVDPQKAAEQSAFLAERPPRAYELSQGQGALSSGWAATLEALGQQAPVSASETAPHKAKSSLVPLKAAAAKAGTAKAAAPVVSAAAASAAHAAHLAHLAHLANTGQSGASASPAAASSKAAQIISFAESFIGKVPYEWGGTTPAGWDCSGFTDYVYRHFGYTGIPRTSEEQWDWVKRTGSPQPGGLAFFAGSDGSQSSPGHVGVIVNGNEMVDAYGTGYGTRYNTIAGSSGAISGYGIPSSGFAAGGPLGYASGNVVVDAIEAATGSEQVREAMALGSWMESRWDPTALQAGGPGVGAFQFSPPSAWGLTTAEAEDPTDAVKAILPSYTSAVSQVGTSAWKSNAELASEEAAVLAERPATTYYNSQGTAAVNAGWAATLEALGTSSTPAAPAPVATTASAPASAAAAGVTQLPVPWLAGFSAGTAHNILTAAGMTPTAAAGQVASWWATGSTPAGDSLVSPGSSVAILASVGASPVPVRVPDLAGYAAGAAHNILVAAGLIPTAIASQQAWWQVTGTSPAAGTTVTAGTRVTIIGTANTVMVPNLVGYTAGAAHNALVAAGLVPTAATGQQPYWYCTGTTPAGGTMTSPGTRVTILATAASTPPSGAAAAANWPAASAAMIADVPNEMNAFWALNAFSSWPSALTSDQWGQWYADLGILQHQQQLVGMSGSWAAMQPLLATPDELTTTDWLTFGSRIGDLLGWIQDSPTPPSSTWGLETDIPWPSGYKGSSGATPGHIQPTSWAPWKYAHPQWIAAVDAIKTLNNDQASAYGAWQALYGPAGSVTTSPPTPGVQVFPAGGGPTTIDIEALVPGGPAFPVMDLQAGSASATGSGFAAGGPLPSISLGGLAGGGEVSLADVAGMFAMGGYMPQMPAGQPGLAARLSGGAQETPRTISTAAGSSSGDRVGVKIGNITISNPVPEKTSDSITRSSNRLSYLAGRGPV